MSVCLSVYRNGEKKNQENRKNLLCYYGTRYPYPPNTTMLMAMQSGVEWCAERVLIIVVVIVVFTSYNELLTHECYE